MYFKTIGLFLLILTHVSWSMTVDEKQMLAWEKKALEEVAKYKGKQPEKEFLLYMTAARELANHGLDKKAVDYYLKAFKHPTKSDKTEAVIQLVALNKDNKTELPQALERAREWFKSNPDKQPPQLANWLKMMAGYAAGNTPIENQGYYTFWAIDSKVSELMAAGKVQEAYQTLGPRDLSSADINQKIRQDLLAAAVLGKEASPPLWCLDTLNKYPTSITWSMKICRYLEDWKSGNPPRESIQGIREQIQAESPERLYWMSILERL